MNPSNAVMPRQDSSDSSELSSASEDDEKAAMPEDSSPALEDDEMPGDSSSASEDEKAAMTEDSSPAFEDDGYENVAYTFTRRPQGSHKQSIAKARLPARPADEAEDEPSPIDNRPPYKHFLHLHVMQLFSLRKKDEKNCKICSLIISGGAYGCKRCNFYIHELCSEFPRHIHHAAHSAHSLELRVTKSVTTPEEDFACKACRYGTEKPDQQGPDGRTTPAFRVHYRCVPCGFAMHITCAATSRSIIIGDDRVNPVNLYTNFPLQSELGVLECDQCKVEITQDMWVFFSRNTSKIFHFTCLADNAYGRFEYKDFITGVSKRLQVILSHDAWRKKSSEVHREIWHRHVLHQLNRITPAPVCQLCGSNIYDYDMYGCKACSYYFHKNCSRIPQAIQHPGHMEHRLALVCFPEKKNPCRACGDPCYWFSYGCSSCEFYINLNYGKCASYPESLGINVSSGDSKQFTLFYKFPYPKEVYAIKCDKCGNNISKDVWMFYNRETDLKYHTKCAAEKANLDLGWTAAIDRLAALEVD